MTPQELCDDWNRKYDSGIAVIVYGAGQPFRAVTRMGAIVHAGRAVTAIDPRPSNWGPYALIEYMRAVDPIGEEGEERLEYTRAGGMATCERCGRTLREHPMDLEHVGYDRRPFLHVRCDGSLVKL